MLESRHSNYLGVARTGTRVQRLSRNSSGSRSLDRTAAFDTFSVNLTGLIAVLAIQQKTTLHFDLAIMVSLVPFMFSVVVAKFIVKGDIIDRDSN